MRHRPRVERSLSDRGLRVHRMVCTCGERGQERGMASTAQQDSVSHVADLPRVPAGQECRDPRRHDRRPWEPCALCAAQMPLFDLGDVTETAVAS